MPASNKANFNTKENKKKAVRVDKDEKPKNTTSKSRPNYTLAHQKIMEKKKMKLMDGKEPREGSNKYPQLLPVVAKGYNLNKRLLADIYLKELSHAIYLLWSDGLYADESGKLNPKAIYETLKPLMKNSENYISLKNIFVLANNPTDSQKKVPTPAGACFIMVNRSHIGKDDSLVMSKIVANRLHMLKVSLVTLRQHMKDNQILIFSAGHPNLLDDVPFKYIEALADDAPLSPVQQLYSSAPKEEKQPLVPEGYSTTNQTTKIQSKQAKQAKSSQPQQDATLSKLKHVNMESDVDDAKYVIVLDETKEGAEEAQEAAKTESETHPQKETIASPSDTVTEGSGEAEFLPVTEKSLAHVLAVMCKFGEQKRAVAIVFDPCFFLPNLSMAMVREKYKPIFGTLDKDQVLVRVNSPELASDLDAAKKLDIKQLNQAYIVGAPGLTEQDINRKAAARGIFCCPMTMGCVEKNLKRGVFLVHKDVLSAKPSAVAPATHPVNKQRIIDLT